MVRSKMELGKIGPPEALACLSELLIAFFANRKILNTNELIPACETIVE
jgi:hypothetical protein